MDSREARGIYYVFGFTGTKALAAKVEVVADDKHVGSEVCGSGKPDLF